jgi:hypothetical protein
MLQRNGSYSHLESPFNSHLSNPNGKISPPQQETHMQQEVIQENMETATLPLGNPP